jgi:hypothetical protein
MNETLVIVKIIKERKNCNPDISRKDYLRMKIFAKYDSDFYMYRCWWCFLYLVHWWKTDLHYFVIAVLIRTLHHKGILLMIQVILQLQGGTLSRRIIIIN